jgi:holliday junction DNA helicase RuvA
MISWLEGTIIQTTPRFVVINVAGVGYKVWIGGEAFQNSAKTIGKKISTWIHMVVREDTHDLYGFATIEELEFFELLITISGIGPKTAAGIMNVASITTLRGAIVSNDPSYLTNIPGIGKKNAEKIVRELQDKLIATDSDVISESSRHESDVLEALKSLGYPEREAREAIKKIPKEVVSPGDRVKHALKILGTK